MNNIESNSRPSFFPNSRQGQEAQAKKTEQKQKLMQSALRRNNAERIKELEKSTQDAKVDISNSIRDFSRIKKTVDTAPEMNNADKVQQLKEQVQNGTYTVDPEQLADKLLEKEFRA